MIKLNTRKRRISVAVAAAAIVAVGGGLAVAYWTSGGIGTGTATTGSSSGFVLDSSAPTGGPLTPGGPSETVAFTVTNPSSGIQNLSDVTVTVANADGTEWTAVTGCSAADYTVSAADITYGDIASLDFASGTVTVSMNNLDSDQDLCQGVTVPLYFVAT